MRALTAVAPIDAQGLAGRAEPWRRRHAPAKPRTGPRPPRSSPSVWFPPVAEASCGVSLVRRRGFRPPPGEVGDSFDDRQHRVIPTAFPLFTDMSLCQNNTVTEWNSMTKPSNLVQGTLDLLILKILDLTR